MTTVRQRAHPKLQDYNSRICTTDITNINPIISRPGPLSRKEEKSLDITAADENDGFLIDAEEVRPTHVEIQYMTDSGLHIFQETTFDYLIEEIVEAKVVSLLETIHDEAARRDKIYVYRAVEKFKHLVVAQGAVIDVFHIKVDNRAKSQDFVMRKLPSLMSPGLIVKVWLAPVKMNKTIHRRLCLDVPRPITFMHREKRYQKRKGFSYHVSPPNHMSRRARNVDSIGNIPTTTKLVDMIGDQNM